MREVWVRPLGLITKPNEMGVYPPGAMSQANNLVARSAGEIESRPNSQITFNGALTTAWPMKLLWTGFQFFRANVTSGPNVTAEWVDAGVSTAAALQDPANMATAVTNAWLDAVIFRNRIILASESDVQVFDYLDPQTSAQRNARYASLKQPRILPLSATSTNAQALGAGRAVTYMAVFRRVYADGYEVIGPPSIGLRYTNNGVTIVDPGVTISQLNELLPGDFIEIYRSQSVKIPNLGNAPDTGNVEPGTAVFLVSTYTVTSSDISAGFVDLPDSAKDGQIGEGFGGLGRALYTNPGQAGLEGANTPPPAAKRIAAFKGRMFYGNYGTPGDVVIAFRGGVGQLQGTTGVPALPAARRSSVSNRLVASGDITNGSPNILTVDATEHMPGIVPGLAINNTSAFNAANFPHVISAAGTTVVVSVNSSVTQVGASLGFGDVFELVLGYGVAGPVKDILVFSVAFPYITSGRTQSDSNLFDFSQQYYISNLRGPRTSLSLRATNGKNWDPQLPLITNYDNTTGLVTAGGAPLVFPPKEFKNGLRWSKDQQPEAVPATNEIFIGSGEIYGLYSTRDALWIFASDGLWRLAGSMARVGAQVDVRVDPVDSTLILSGPKAGCVLRDSVYAMTNRGLVRVDDSGIAELSDMRIGDILPGVPWSPTGQVVVAADQDNDDIYVTVRPTATLGVNNTTTFVYSTVYDMFTSVSNGQQGWTGATDYAYDALGEALYATINNGSGAGEGDIFKITNTGLSNPPAVYDFQPVTGEAPHAGKQWIDGTVVFNENAAAISGFSVRWNGTSFSGGQNVPAVMPGTFEARINYGCPRDAAVGAAIKVGGVIPNGANTLPIAIKSVSLQFEYLSDQQVQR